MLHCSDIDALMIDRLYDELDAALGARFDAHVEGCARCRAELAGLERTRAALREMPEEEPPPALSAILLHEAARQAPAPSRAAAPIDDEQPRGILAWLVGLLEPIVAHPAATAVATLVVVAGIAGSLYLRGEQQVVEPVMHASAPAPEPATDTPAMVRMPDDNASPGAAAAARDEAAPAQTNAGDGEAKDQYYDRSQQGYSADIATGDKTIALDKLDNRAPAQKAAQMVGSTARRHAGHLSANVDGTKAAPRLTTEPAATTNAVTGADTLVDLDDDNGLAKNAPVNKKRKVATRGGKPIAGAAPTVPQFEPPPPPPGNTASEAEKDAKPYRVYKDSGVAQSAKQQQLWRWAQGQQKQLESLLKLKKCRDAARVANDILDRTPDFYYQKLDRSTALKPCSGFVEAERKTRAARRYRARAAKKSPASSSTKAKAAAQPDEATTSQ